MYTPMAPSLLNKLNKVMAEVSYIQKDKRNSAQGYNYASEAAIKAAMNKAFTVHGVQFLLSIDGVQNDKYEIPNKAGEIKTVFQATVKCAFRFVDIETGDYYEGNAVGIGQDNGDKAIYKAITGAIKYALTGNFLIETGDDAENDEGEEIRTVEIEDPFAETKKPAAKSSKPQCVTCSAEISDKVAQFSVERYGRLLCMTHQPNAK